MDNKSDKQLAEIFMDTYSDTASSQEFYDAIRKVSTLRSERNIKAIWHLIDKLLLGET